MTPRRSICQFLACSFFAVALSAQTPSLLPPFSTFLKANVTVSGMATGPDGSIYVLGASATNGEDIFVGKVDRTTAKFVWSTFFGGKAIDRPAGIAVDGAGAVYFTGVTNSPDFPTAPSLGVPTPADGLIPFAVKLDSNGGVVYCTLFNGSVRADPEAIAVDRNGRVVVTGTSSTAAMSATPGAYSSGWYPSRPPFVVKLDAAGKMMFSAIGIGGSRVALDPAGNIFIAGSTLPYPVTSELYPTTPGAFQTTYTPSSYCLSPSCAFPAPLGQQYVTKLSADGSKLLYSTFVTARGGTMNSGLAIDSEGNAWVTGKTGRGSEYVYTDSISSASRENTFTTKIDPTGSKILVSIRQGGSTLSLDGKGGVVVADTFPAPVPFVLFSTLALPGPSTGIMPPQCLPTGVRDSHGGFVMRLSSSDGALLSTQLITGTNLAQALSTADGEGNAYVMGNTALPDVPLTPAVEFDSALAARNVAGIYLARVLTVDEANVPQRIGCVTDATSSALTSLVAPGQLITIYGNSIGPNEPAVGIGGGLASVPTSAGGVTVSFDGRPAPLLYASLGQINVQVPFEVQPGSSAMEVSLNGALLGSRQLAVVPRNPSVFVSSILPSQLCNGSTFNWLATALALNEDGSVNSCGNPAKAGTEVTVFVNGLGVDSRRKVTGAIAPASPLFLDARVAAFQGNWSLEVSSFLEQASAITGLGQLRLRVPDSAATTLSVTLTVSGELAGTSVTLFVKPR